MTLPLAHDLTIYKGATFQVNFTWKQKNEDGSSTAIDLTGYSARMQARQSYSSAAPFLSSTGGDGGVIAIALGGAAGTIAITIAAAVTAAITAKEGVYDLELVAGDGTVTRLIYGKTKIIEEATR